MTNPGVHRYTEFRTKTGQYGNHTTNGETKMDTYEVKNIAQQKMDSLRDEAAFERLVQGCSVEKSSTLPRIFGTALAILAFLGLVTLNL